MNIARLPGPREFAHLLKTAYSWEQLYVYIWDIKREYKSRYGSSDNRYHSCGHFFNRVYGLDLTDRGEFHLGKYILTGQFKPDSLQSVLMTRNVYNEQRDHFERYWGRL